MMHACIFPDLLFASRNQGVYAVLTGDLGHTLISMCSVADFKTMEAKKEKRKPTPELFWKEYGRIPTGPCICQMEII
jgi:hypothetical protein